ncbi:hypothetical protein [Laspinema palackyanum]|nr:hypothetical protein [Laspinema sp. D2c]
MSFDSEAIAIGDVTLLLLSIGATHPVQGPTPKCSDGDNLMNLFYLTLPL